METTDSKTAEMKKVEHKRRVFISANPEQYTLPVMLATVVKRAFTDAGGIYHGPVTRVIDGTRYNGVVFQYVLDKNAPDYEEQLQAMAHYADKYELVEVGADQAGIVPAHLKKLGGNNDKAQLQEAARRNAEHSDELDKRLTEKERDIEAKDREIESLKKQLATKKGG